jgi:tetratricopeptide (TPR) repeat protein
MMLIITITAFVILRVKRLPYLVVGWLWYAIILLPVIGIVQVGNHAMADRYTYLPLIGISVGLAWGVPFLFVGRHLQKNIVPSLTIVFLLLLTFLSWQQCRYWKNSIRLFTHVLRVTKDNYIAHGSLGIALSKEGKIKESIDHYNKAISIRPDYYKPYDSRGFAYDTLGRYQQAIEDFSAAIHLNPDHVVSYNNRGASYDKSGQHQKALEDYNTAIRMKPDYAEAFNNRGIVLFKLGQYHKAFEDFSQAIHFNPRFADAYNNRAVVYLNQNNIVSGCLDARKACELGMCTTLQAAATRELCR